VGRIACRVAIPLLLVACGGQAAPGLRVRTCKVDFAVHPAATVREVAVIGDFNGWVPDGHRLARGDDGTFRGSFVVGPGRQAYRFRIDGDEVLDDANPLTLYGRDGREHSALVQPDCTLPGWEVGRYEVRDGRFQAHLDCLAGAGGSPCDPASLAVLMDGAPIADGALQDGILDLDLAPRAPGKHRVELRITDTAGLAAEPLALPYWVEAAPFAWEDAVIYQVMVDRFRRGDGTPDADAGITMRMGGDWAGVTGAIIDGTFARLGVNVLWISPAVRNAEGTWPGFDGRQYQSYHGYWPVAAREAEPRFGGADGLDALVRTAHDRGMRVILDIVPNHVHQDHPYFAEHRQDWFNHPDGDCVCGRQCSWATDIDECWFIDYLPDLDWRQREVVDTMLADVSWWLTRFDVDGLRVDAVPMMPRLVTRHLRDTVTRAFAPGAPHVYLVGETFTGSLGRDQIRWYLGPYGLSGQFDFPLMWALRTVLGQAGGLMTDLLDEMDRSLDAWSGSGAVMGHMIGNHDVPRFASVAAGDSLDVLLPPPQPTALEPYRRAALALAFVMTQPGAPIVYQGDELGLAGAGDPDNRRPMPAEATWTEPQRWLFGQAATLGRLRGTVSAMRAGQRVDLVRTHDHVVYRMQGAADAALIGLNRAAVPVRVEVPAGGWPEGTGLVDCLGGAVTRTGGTVELVLPALGAMVVVPAGGCPPDDPAFTERGE
jgi:glycosidase